jgi:hypothetical protein
MAVAFEDLNDGEHRLREPFQKLYISCSRIFMTMAGKQKNVST